MFLVEIFLKEVVEIMFIVLFRILVSTSFYKLIIIGTIEIV